MILSVFLGEGTSQQISAPYRKDWFIFLFVFGVAPLAFCLALFVNREALRVLPRQMQVQVGPRPQAEAYVTFLSPESKHLFTFSRCRQHSCSSVVLTAPLS